ncbi:glyoxalase superfamily protein [Paenibacillus sp. UMB4589-SE434]|uniref:glyoxalase superfamily protein n=1 Tax=Paenibacillus sp. UMB4589-SE434 TaxID=3046314 RepID=UPI00254DA673|nr:glyoxalase superfamily protein [Paenibacillus sp. UMB4589-SE434]MDK8180560.1 glyoxalase superfamily protein [Paenibacillus sp. UMB4589-SE434]
MDHVILMKSSIPMLRIFDVAKAQEFYVEYLGFQVDWEHRYGDDFPLYMQVSWGECVIHLTEHYGDCCPGGGLRIEVSDIQAFHQLLHSRPYRYARPGLDDQATEMAISDPFGNRLIFHKAR